MFEIQTNNTYIETKLNELVSLLKERGAYFDPSLVLKEEGGNFSVTAKQKAEKPFWMKIPHNALTPFKEIAFDLQGDDLVLDDFKGNYDHQNYKIIELLLSLYNETGKIAAHKKDMVWCQLKGDADRPLVEHLLKARDYENQAFIQKVWGDEELYDEMVLVTFFMSRLIDCKLNRRIGTKPVKCIVPFIELLNHDAYGSGYDNLYNKKGGAHMGVRMLPSFEPMDEICTNYGYFDGLDLLMQYGFLYQEAPFLCSVPMEFDLGDVGRVSLKAHHVVVPLGDIPEDYRDLGRYFPAMYIDHVKKNATLSHLFIPSEVAPFSLRRILRFVLTQMDSTLSEERCLAYIYDIESKIIETNLLYFSHFDRLCEGKRSDMTCETIKKLKKSVSDKINNYQEIVKTI